MFKSLYTATGYYEPFANAPNAPKESAPVDQNLQTSFPTTIQGVLDIANKSGIYKMWSPITNQVVRVYVYKEEHTGKKWVLVMRYNHRGGTNPELRPIPSGDFPIPTVPILDDYKNEVDTDGWGHLTPQYLSRFKINEVAFFGSTTAHGRVINFTTSSEFPINYVSSAKGMFAGGRCYCTQPGTLFNREESASLPQHATHYATHKDLTESPFYVPGQAYWSVRVDGYRWEVDNSLDPDVGKPPPPLTGIVLEEKRKRMYENDTLHMVFIC